MKAAIALILYLFAVPHSIAHHSISEDADLSSLFVLSGTIEKVDWKSPHVLIYVSARSSNPSLAQWIIEADSPAALLRNGVNRDILSEIDTINFVAYSSRAQPCSTECYGYGLNVTTSTGNTYILHEMLNNLLNGLN